MRLAFLYAGQGAQRVGMGADLYEQFQPFRSAIDSAGAIAGFDLKRLCFEGPEDLLCQTRYTQPCMAAFAIGVTDVLTHNGIRPSAAAGLSLGEYSALYAAGALSPVSAISLVSFRAKAMERAAAGVNSGMAAVLGLPREEVERVCREASALGTVCPANYNCPGQIAIAGVAPAVDEACRLAKEAGAKRCMPIKVSGPFHTPLMAPAGEELRGYMQKNDVFYPLRIPVYFNCTGRAMSVGESVQDLLVRQVQSSVYMEDSMRAMEKDGIDTIIEIGPGKVLSGFVRKTAPQIAVHSAETASGISELIQRFKGAM